MSRTRIKSTALYSTPFSKAYWRDAAAELKSTKTIVIAALMIALRVATKGLAVPIAPNLDLFNIASFINALGAMIIGPVVAIPAAFISDFIGVMIWDGLATYFLPYALQEIGSSLIWALLLYRAKPTPWRVMLGRLSICLIINVVLGTSIDMLWQTVYYGQANMVLTLPRVLKNTFMFPIESVVMTFFLGLMIPITNRMGLTYSGSDAKDKMVFGKKQIALLAVLFVVGVGCVLGYLNFYYSTTSLSGAYTTEERIEANKSMEPIVLEKCDDWDDDTVVTIVESAYRPFLGSETTYNVAVYTADQDKLSDGLDEVWKLSKSKAAKHEALSRVATAVIVVNDRTGEVLSFEVTPQA
jgi:ECF transporter S component (folate family)